MANLMVLATHCAISLYKAAIEMGGGSPSKNCIYEYMIAVTQLRATLVPGYLCRADGFTELASDAPLLARGIPPKGMFTSEPRTERPFLKRIVDSSWLFEEVTEGYHVPCKPHKSITKE